MTLASLDVSSKKRCLSRLFTYHLKAHTISNKLVSKVFAQKKGKKVVMTAQICVEISVVSGVDPLKPKTSSGVHVVATTNLRSDYVHARACFRFKGFGSRLFSTLKLGGVHRKKNNKTTRRRLRPLATFVPSLGRCGQGAWL